MKNLTVAIFAILSLSISIESKDLKVHDFMGMLKDVDISDGVNKEESIILAYSYCLSSISGCGMPVLEKETKESWWYLPLVGISGTPTKPLVEIRKDGSMITRTGEIRMYQENGAWKIVGEQNDANKSVERNE